MTDKLSNWAESKNRYDDLTHAMGGDEATESLVGETVTKSGVVILSNCGNCGRQWKGRVTWGEIVMFYLGHPVPGTRATRGGVYLLCKCNGCGKDTPVLVDWDEVRKYIDAGLRCGAFNEQGQKAIAQAKGR
jgi:hypothetical protein